MWRRLRRRMASRRMEEGDLEAQLLARTQELNCLAPSGIAVPCERRLLRPAKQRDHSLREITKCVQTGSHLEACAEEPTPGPRLQPDAGLSRTDKRIGETPQGVRGLLSWSVHRLPAFPTLFAAGATVFSLHARP